MKRSHIIAIVLIAVSIGVMISTYGDSSSYENFDTAQQNPDREYHVVGKLVNAEMMQYNPTENANLFTFYLQDNQGKTCKVVYYNTKPQEFERADQVVIVGNMHNDHFEAKTILTKCPSKYDDKKVEIKA
jgi:cytochrome c-type biogenesis protein CcmE